MSKKVILTADDYGVSNFFNRGILDAIRKNKINSVASFVTHRLSKSSILELQEKKRNENLDFEIGLHFSVTSGFSCQHKKSSLTSFEDDNLFWFRLADGYNFAKTKPIDLENELIAQLQILDEYLGNEPINHVSCHHGISYIKMDFFEIFVKTIQKYSRENPKYQDRAIPIRCPISWLKIMRYGLLDSINVPIVIDGFNLGMLKKLHEVTLEKLKRRYEFATQKNIPTSNIWCDIIYGQPSINLFDEIVRKIPDNNTVELMFHIGNNLLNNSFTPHGINANYINQRQLEYNELINWDLSHTLNQNNVELTNFSQL